MLFYAAVALAGFAGTSVYVALRDGATLPWQRGHADTATAATDGTASVRTAAGAVAAGGFSGAAQAGWSEAGSDDQTMQKQRVADAVSEASQLAISGSDREQRSAGLNRLVAMASGPAAIAEPGFVAALEVAATSDQEWQMRVRAVIALTRAAQQMTDRSRVIAILERAAADPQKSVATHARRGLATLTAVSADAVEVPPG
jgi:hypothetical protein